METVINITKQKGKTKMERLNPIETSLELGKNALGLALNIGRVAIHQLKGGGWSEFADTCVPAQITHYGEQLELSVESDEC